MQTVFDLSVGGQEQKIVLRHGAEQKDCRRVQDGRRRDSKKDGGARCGISAEEAAISLDAISPVTSLSDFVYGEDTVTYEGVLADEESERESEMLCDRIALSQCIERLPPLWKKIVLMRYYRNMTQQETASCLGLTQVKVSREEKKILAALRADLSGSS